MMRPLKFLTAALAMAMASSASAYGDGQAEKAFYVVDVKSTAPLRVTDDFWGKHIYTPQQLLDLKCPGAKVAEVHIANWESSRAVQIEFEMPANGCKDAGD